jgi:hypothetical protein
VTQKKLFDMDLTKARTPLKYIKRKLLAEEITVIKKALVYYGAMITHSELDTERTVLLSKLNHPDYFMCIYTAKRKKGKKDKKNDRKPTADLPRAKPIENS